MCCIKQYKPRTVGNDSIFIVDSNGEYHKPGCLKLIENLKSNNVTITGAYASSEFQRKQFLLLEKTQTHIANC